MGHSLVTRSALAAATFALLLVAPAATSIQLPALAPSVTLEPVMSGSTMPLLATHAGDGSGRLFVVEQLGLVKVVGSASPFLDLRSKVRCCGERGLLGLAFEPGFATTGRLYVSYSRSSDGAHMLDRMTVVPATGQVIATQNLIALADPFANHNGGHITFGPDGHLYLSLGDGGSADDPLQNGQNKNVLLGKILRLDVSGNGGYAIPPDNPFSSGGGLPEIWAYGLRNPWRFSFDRATGDLWIADVGQNLMEEIDLAPAGTPGGVNYGWDTWEGILPHEGIPDRTGMTFPILTYLHQPHCSVTGGYVVRGPSASALAGTYVYGDFCSGFLWGATQVNGQWIGQQLAATDLLISSFGEDEAGDVYVVDHSGAVFRLTTP